MKAKAITGFLIAAMACFADEDLKIEYKPLSIGALEEFGVLQSGRFGTKTETFESEWVDRAARVRDHRCARPGQAKLAHP